MTLWARALVVIVTVLSLVFAGMSAVIFAKRQALREDLKKEQALHAFDVSTRDSQITAFKGDLASKQATIEQANTTVNGLTLQVATLTNELKQSGIVLGEAKSNLLLALDEVRKATENNGMLSKQNVDLTQENGVFRTANIAIAEQLSAMTAEKNRLASANATLTDELKQTAESLSAAKDTIALNSEVFNKLAERNIEARTIINSLQTLPDVKAKVITVDRDRNMVVLNVGKNQNVRKNFEFTVWRDGTFVAKVNVFDVQDDLSAARVVTSKEPIQLGDNAWTRLQ